ncbi:signal peptidase II [Streptococcus iniae]|uniref:regulatory iron-sulfur-containing complex subunit RicT n=1 Tax=Streptococcus iniae TaxID=1346 RepID=UPI000282F771|nr:regulatory iron-sulfur-containing complex subunit RicT [Streptococcus iniae]AJG26384.1 signal peptidase II [Streptococcus iniae]ATX40198.1 hypothetical protein CTW00_02024 [Streptococcus iniae]EKB51742.1 stage 0 sporulation protein YaaT [Streptococcus iniae 9117]ELY5748005.1 signal peptidase II [Streptococcus iniae]ELY5750399.1 signal peptidase II [Streptococcus iniae]
MIRIIGFKYNESDLIKYAQTTEDFRLSDWVVVKDAKGSRMAKVYFLAKDLNGKQVSVDSSYHLRKPNDRDLKAFTNNADYAQESRERVKELFVLNQLEMKLIDIVFSLERSYVLITFSAEERVDFRQLLKDLASLFKTRIELRQINSREEAKLYGGLGPCGRPLCCSSFLGEFPTVSIKMLKNQGLSLNNGKTTGNCGRLLCCLQYEDAFYQECKQKFPDYGAKVETKEGTATVVGIDLFAETLQLKFEDKQTLMTYALEEVTVGK